MRAATRLQAVSLLLPDRLPACLPCVHAEDLVLHLDGSLQVAVHTTGYVQSAWHSAARHGNRCEARDRGSDECWLCSFCAAVLRMHGSCWARCIGPARTLAHAHPHVRCVTLPMLCLCLSRCLAATATHCGATPAARCTTTSCTGRCMLHSTAHRSSSSSRFPPVPANCVCHPVACCVITLRSLVLLLPFQLPTGGFGHCGHLQQRAI